MTDYEQDFERLLRVLEDGETGLTPWMAMQRWRRRFWFLLVLSGILVVILFALLVNLVKHPRC